MIDMIEYLNAAIESKDNCEEYSGTLVAIWIEIVEAHDDSSLQDHMTSLMNIQCVSLTAQYSKSIVINLLIIPNRDLQAMENNDCLGDKVQNKINLMSLLSVERNSKFTAMAFGGMQQLEDFIQNIFCEDIR